MDINSMQNSTTNTRTDTDTVEKPTNPKETEVENPYDKKKRKKTSKVWDDFKEVTLPDGCTKVACIHCGKQLAYTKSGPTTQFKRHLDICTRKKLADKGQKQLTVTALTTETETIGSIQNFKYDHSRMREVISHMIMVHELPFNLVEYEIFNLAMKTSNPLYEKISRTTVKNDCVSSYEIEKKRIICLLKRENRVSITTDLWKSGQNIQYMVVTSHFVDENFILNKCVLSFIKMTPPHTGVAVCDALKNCFIEWGIESKVWTVTVDNASYNDNALDNLRMDLKLINPKLPLDDKFLHVRCCAHILNLLVQHGLTEIKHVIENIRESVRHIGKSIARLHMFGEIVKQLKLNSKKLVLDCATRWNSTFLMLTVTLEYKDIFPRYKLRDDSYNFLPSEDDIRKAQVVSSFLKNYTRITTLISGSEYPTANLFLSELWTVKKWLDKAWDNSDHFMEGMIQKMKDKFDKYWGANNLLISVAAIMDPRFKMFLVKFTFKDLYPSFEASDYSEEVRETLYKLYEEYVEAYKSKNPSKEVGGSSSPLDGSAWDSTYLDTEESLSSYYNYIKNVDSVSVETTKSELDLYLESGVVLHNANVDPPFDALAWWKENKDKYCILSQMAVDILSIPITSVASECAFSAGSRVIEPHRASLGAETAEMLICGADWLRSRYGIKRKREKINVEEEEEEVHYELP